MTEENKAFVVTWTVRGLAGVVVPLGVWVWNLSTAGAIQEAKLLELEKSCDRYVEEHRREVSDLKEMFHDHVEEHRREEVKADKKTEEATKYIVGAIDTLRKQVDTMRKEVRTNTTDLARMGARR